MSYMADDDFDFCPGDDAFDSNPFLAPAEIRPAPCQKADQGGLTEHPNDDDDFDSNPFLAPAEILPAPSQKEAHRESEEDSGAVDELLNQLRAAKDLGLDAEFGADFDIEFEPEDEEGQCAKKARKDEEHQEDASITVKVPAAAAAKEYWYNPVTNRWEPSTTYKESDEAKYKSAQRAKDTQVKKLHQQKRQQRETTTSASVPRPRQEAKFNFRLNYSYKTDLCWQFKRGTCKKGDRCYWAHGEEELRGGGDAETLKQRIIAECIAEARSDAQAGTCEYPQALVVHLALRFEDKPDEMLANMAEAGLPTGADRRTTVKALTRLCHPDKCHHPEAKKAMQILGPLLGAK